MNKKVTLHSSLRYSAKSYFIISILIQRRYKEKEEPSFTFPVSCCTVLVYTLVEPHDVNSRSRQLECWLNPTILRLKWYTANTLNSYIVLYWIAMELISKVCLVLRGLGSGRHLNIVVCKEGYKITWRFLTSNVKFVCKRVFISHNKDINQLGWVTYDD